VDPSITVPDAYSPEFLTAVERVLAFEGGYSSNPDDPGGVTNFGISARSHPGLDIAALTRDAAIEIYWRQWWLRFGFARLPAAAAAKTFDLAVNIGAGCAIQCLQRALRACGRLCAIRPNRGDDAAWDQRSVRGRRRSGESGCAQEHREGRCG